jgi:hypothetical protein
MMREISSESEEEIEESSIQQVQRKAFSLWIRENWFVKSSKQFVCSAVIDPQTKAYYVTSFLIVLMFGYNLFYVPVSIVYEYEAGGLFYIMDGLAVAYYILDIWIRAHTGYINDRG